MILQPRRHMHFPVFTAGIPKQGLFKLFTSSKFHSEYMYITETVK